MKTLLFKLEILTYNIILDQFHKSTSKSQFTSSPQNWAVSPVICFQSLKLSPWKLSRKRNKNFNEFYP